MQVRGRQDASVGKADGHITFAATMYSCSYIIVRDTDIVRCSSSVFAWPSQHVLKFHGANSPRPLSTVLAGCKVFFFAQRVEDKTRARPVSGDAMTSDKGLR